MINYNSQKGISLYYAILIMSISLAIALGLNTIVVKSFRTTQEVKKSPPALHAADTGVEEALYKISQGDIDEDDIDDGVETTWTNLDSGAKYKFEIVASTSPRCADDAMYCIFSSGEHEGSKRFIKATR